MTNRWSKGFPREHAVSVCSLLAGSLQGSRCRPPPMTRRSTAVCRRIIAVRKNMHLGQAVRFVDWRDGSLREGKVVAMREAQAHQY